MSEADQKTRNELRAALYAALARLGADETRKVVDECLAKGGAPSGGDRWSGGDPIR